MENPPDSRETKPKIPKKGKPSKYVNKSTDKYNRNKDNPNKKVKIKKPKRDPNVPRVKKPPPPKNKEYYCYCTIKNEEGKDQICNEVFKNWGDARKHMVEVHKVNKPKLKRSLTYISGPRAEKQKAERAEEEEKKKKAIEKRILRDQKKKDLQDVPSEPIQNENLLPEVNVLE